jgi:hypothetical protein
MNTARDTALHPDQALHVPGASRSILHLSTPEEIRDFHARASIAAEQFKAHYKDHTGKEPKPECLLSAGQQTLVNQWLATPEGAAKISALSDRVISFVTETVGRGHPGHDKRHVLLKDPISALRIALEEDLSPAQQLFILPSLLHDAGRLFEPQLFDKPQSGTLGVDHTILGFAITNELLGDSLTTDNSNPELALALKNLHDEILNAVLDHQSGNSRTSLMAQYVQRADREQLVGYEALHRFISFDVGFYGLDIHAVCNSELRQKLPPPGTPEDSHLLVHAEFYARNLFENIGARASEHANQGKIETGRFLALAATPAMREQIFAPEIQRDLHQEVASHWSKKPLSSEVWDEIRSFVTPELIGHLDRIRGNRTLKELVDNFIHPPHATRTDSGSYTNWNTIVEKLGVLGPDENRRFGRALTYGLNLASETDAADRAIVHQALERFERQPHSLVYKVARLVMALQMESIH